MPEPVLPPLRDGRRVWWRVGALLDGEGGDPLRHASIVFDSKAIHFVGGPETSPPSHLLADGQRQPDLDMPDQTLLPGLIEAHAHLFLEGGELDLAKRAAYLRQTPADLLAAARQRLERLVHLGVVAVRDAGDKDGVGLALSRLYASTERPVMPYLDSPGAAIHHRGRYGSFMAEPIEDHPSPRACVEARVAAGADRIKLIPTGIINFQAGAVTTEPQMTTAEVSELVVAAKALGRQTFAHASGDKGIERAIEGGVDSIEHGFFIRDDQLAFMRDRQIAWAPTFAPVQMQLDHAAGMGWDDDVVSKLRRILDNHAATLLKARALGVILIAGSDAGSYGVAHGHGFLHELELMERAGLTASAVLHAATGASAGRLAFKEKFGFIKAGHLSRFILTRHSPLDTISNLRKPRAVVFDGVIFEQGAETDTPGL
jgi:imidazolonepropionase-like amidohydrolase